MRKNSKLELLQINIETLKAFVSLHTLLNARTLHCSHTNPILFCSGRENGISGIHGRIKIKVGTVISEKWPSRKPMARPTPGSLQQEESQADLGVW